MKKRIYIIVLNVLIFLILFSLVSYGEDAKTYYKLGYSYYSQKNYKEAIKAYKKALKLDPKNADAAYWLGKSYFELGQYSNAMNSWIQALKIKESHRGAFSKLISYYYYLIPKSFKTPQGYLNYAKQILKVDENNFIGDKLSIKTLLIGFASLKRYLRDYPSSILGNFLIGQVYERLSYNFTYQFYGYAISAYKKVIDYEEQKHKDSFSHPMEYWFSYKRLIKIYKIIDRKDLAEKYIEKMKEAIDYPYNVVFKKNNLEPLGVPDRIEIRFKDGEKEEVWYYKKQNVSFIYKDGVLKQEEERP